MSHPNEQDLALYATGDLSFFSRLTVARHVRGCQACSEVVEEYRRITMELANAEPQIEDWNILAAEMSANIRLGLEAGACLPEATPAAVSWFTPRLMVAMASLMILAAAGVALRQDHPGPGPTVLAGQQQSVKVDTEGVTITNVYME